MNQIGLQTVHAVLCTKLNINKIPTHYAGQPLPLHLHLLVYCIMLMH